MTKEVRWKSDVVVEPRVHDATYFGSTFVEGVLTFLIREELSPDFIQLRFFPIDVVKWQDYEQAGIIFDFSLIEADPSSENPNPIIEEVRSLYPKFQEGPVFVLILEPTIGGVCYGFLKPGDTLRGEYEIIRSDASPCPQRGTN